MQPNPNRQLATSLTPAPGRLGHSLPTPYVLNSSFNTPQPSFGRFATPQMRRCAPGADQMDSTTDSLSQMRIFDMYGSPSYPKALDNVRTKCHGAAAAAPERDLRSPEIRLEDFVGDGMNAVSYAQGYSRGSFAPADSMPPPPPQPRSASSATALSSSWKFHSFIGSADVGVLFPTTVRNPNKALVTVDGDTVVLIANEMACELFGYSRERIVGMRLKELFASPFREKQEYLAEEHIDTKGHTVMVNGKVVDAVDSTGASFPVSMWMKKVATEPEVRCITVLEPVEKTLTLLQINKEGRIDTCDNTFLYLGGYPSQDDILGKPLTDFIPAFQMPSGLEIPKEIRKQQATLRAHDGNVIPLALAIRPSPCSSSIDDVDSESSRLDSYKVLLSTFANISGMLSFLPGGQLHGYNENFTRLLFGHGKMDLQEKNITFLIPDFFLTVSDGLLDSGSLPLPPFDDDEIIASKRLATTQPGCGGGGTATTSSSLGSISLDTGGSASNQSHQSPKTTERPISPRNDSGVASAPANQDQQQTAADLATSTPAKVNPVLSSSLIDASPVVTTTQSRASSRASGNVVEGSFLGYGTHKDGSSIPIMFDVKRVDLDDGGHIYCVWVSRNVVMETNRDRSLLDWSASFVQPMDGSNRFREGASASFLSAVEEQPSAESLPYIEDGSPGSLEEAAACRGDYEKAYATLKSIGKGAFGFVKLAQKRENNELAVVKFIRKARVLDECWHTLPSGDKMPLEIHLLQTLNHPNIVKLITLYENEVFYQMVMEKHGDGIDLFEFIDRGPHMDELLASYLFRQIVAAVDYLHSKNITHRDIKDENVIINRKFHCKLIDFGSAAFMVKGKLFGTFCGTMEYCAPEVLLGNKYPGPELECWSMGVTLYTVIFGENPFFDVDETIQARFQPPFIVSPPLMHLFLWILHPNPKARATVKDMTEHKWVTQPYNPANYHWEVVFPGARSESALENIQEEGEVTDNSKSSQAGRSEIDGEATPSDSEGEELQDQLKKQYDEESEGLDIQTEHMDISQEMSNIEG